MRAPGRPLVHRVRRGEGRLAISKHAHARVRQRGVKAEDVDLIADAPVSTRLGIPLEPGRRFWHSMAR
jgi:hypothetical protein